MSDQDSRMTIKVMVLCFIIAMLLIAMALVYPVKADTASRQCFRHYLFKISERYIFKGGVFD